MNNKYSLSAESYGISKIEWRELKNEVLKDNRDSNYMAGKHQLEPNQRWFLYDILLQEKYNHLYKREELVNPKVDDYVYCDYEGFGRGIIKSFSLDKSIMVIKFDKRDLATWFNSSSMTATHNEVKIKITKL